MAAAAVLVTGLYANAGWRRPGGAALELARGGRSGYVVVRPREADAAELFAARDLALYLGKATGAAFRVVAEGDASARGAPKIYVGATDFAAERGIETAKLGREEWVMRSVDRDLILTGGRPRGTLFAVYEFLEDQVGCVWLDEDTEVVPKLDVLAVPRLRVRDKPAFWFRQIYTLAPRLWPGTGAGFRLRNKASVGLAAGGSPHSGSPGACHTFYAYSKDWPEDEPELFSMNQVGERDRATSGSGPGHMCLTNPKVPKLVAAKLKKFIERDRQAATRDGTFPPVVYDISQNDNNQYICLCPECRKLTEAEGSASGLMIHFINQVADAVRDSHPDVLVQTFAYTSTQKPPKTLKPRDNVLIRLCHLGGEFRGELGGEYFKPVRDPANRYFRDYIREWGRRARHLAIWDYWILYREEFPNPYVNASLLKADIEAFRKNRAETVFIECEAPETTSFFALKRWLGYKLLDDPDQPDAPLIETFMRGYYGPASPPMLAYLTYLESRIAQVSERMSLLKASERPYLDLAFFVTSQKYLDEAEGLCRPGSPELLHVRRERIPVDSALYNLWSKLAKQLPEGQAMPFDREAVLKRYEACRLEQMEARRKGGTLVKGKAELAEELARYREQPIVERRRAAPPPRVSVPKIKAVAGGDPLKADWAGARDLGQWSDVQGFSTKRKLSVRVAHDGARLYVRLEDECDTSRLVSRREVWAGDDWELFFAAERGTPPYRQIAVSPTGATIAYIWPKRIRKGPPKKWTDHGAQVSCSTDAGRWTASFSIPLANLVPGGAAPGRSFYANFYRASDAAKSLQAWSPNFERGFHFLDRLGELSLE